MYRIGILEKDTAYLNRLVDFLREHHRDSFEINVADAGEADWDNLCLDDLYLDVIPYDALFVGDDITVDGGLPADIMTGFLTEKEKENDRCVNKYQSMEKIYRHMLAICEEGREAAAASSAQGCTREHDLRPETVAAGGETYRVYHIGEAEVDRLAVKMLAANQIKGLPQTFYSDGELRVCITGMESLYDFVRTGNTARGKQELLRLFEGMARTALGLEEYLLSADRLMLDPREIYVAKGEAFVPYIPVRCDRQKNTKEFLSSLRELCDVLLDGLRGTAPESGFFYVPDEDIASAAQLFDNDSYGSTDAFENLQKNAQDSLKLKELASRSEEEAKPYLTRRRTGEKILIDRNIFKLGKDEAYVDYCIRDNPAVSRNHADIVKKADGFYLVDKGSLNHTFVDGKKLLPDEYKMLEDGCLLQLADEVFQFSMGRG